MEGVEEGQKKGRLVLKVVPWINKLEFETVHEKLYSEDPVNQRWAVDRISAWTARNPSAVPVGVDATAALVRAKIQDYTVQNNISLSNFSDVSLMYGMALIRFVNIITEEGHTNEHRTPLRLIARKYGIPDWIIQLRHQATHSSSPSLEKLRSATDISLQWLDEFYWKAEIANTMDYRPTYNDAAEIACQEALSNFQKLQYECLFGTENSGKNRQIRSSVKQVVAEITSLAKTNGKCLVKTLAKPEFLLSLTACSRLLLESSDPFIQKEVVTLPRNIQKFWQPVIAVIHQKNLLEELVLALLKAHNKLCDENQRIAIAWIWKILEASAASWPSQEKKDVGIFKAIKQMPPIFNWFQLLDVCLHNCSKYIPAVLPIITEHIFPPLPESKKNCLMGLVAIATGALADVHSNNMVLKSGQRVYNIESIKTVLELQDVVDRGETSLCHTENHWKLATDDINWADYPLGFVFGLENGILGPKDLQMDELSRIKSEARNETLEEPSVVSMECDVNKPLNESTEVPVGKEKTEEDLEAEENESHSNECKAYYCDPEDVFVF